MTDTRELHAIAERAKAFADERDWKQFHDPKNLAMALGSEVGELMAILRWTSNAAADEYAQLPANKQRIAEELGDIGILLLLLCDRLGTSLDEVVSAKLSLNKEKYPADQARGKSEPPTQ